MLADGSSVLHVGYTHPLVLGLDVTGRPLAWLSWAEAAVLYCREKVAWTAGESSTLLMGGTNRLSGQRSYLELSSIIALRTGTARPHRDTPTLCNANLFARDRYHCLYCGKRFSGSSLSRDHIIPTSRGGHDVWSNAATSCKRCNGFKMNRTPEEAAMSLLAVPFVPSFSEHLILSNKRILADQMEFLRSHVPAHRRGAYALVS
ncbi:HNH endonuclease [Aquisalimonas sp.]|uniref:HNH endonuclease n=1 Tax=Aquisalimonas sp. TaxID=1872621 RepID=UPI0025B9A692|nr:HNH endonuclease [Aquisalimonas sp.]